jgi:hypothetical protein
MKQADVIERNQIKKTQKAKPYLQRAVKLWQ